ncbi:MAG TPA: 4Fe-4S binding protein [Anaerolineaceae bacterium]|nr:4Fe-4S binding protein [Anaerolineaceae bacterium]
MGMSEQKSQSAADLPEIDLDSCTQCGACVTACPEGILSMLPGGPVVNRADQCTCCGSCEEACPEGAIRCELEVIWEEDIKKEP